MAVKKVLFIFGTRPEAIKMAPVIKRFKKAPEIFETKICVTAQHRELLDSVLDFFKLQPDFDLNLMTPDQNLYSLSSRIMNTIEEVFKEFNPDFVFVHGDTTTSFISALAGFYNKSIICHIEAGLRTFDINNPFPEELNRQLTSKLTSLHFAPTVNAKENLVLEGINKNIHVTGNTVIDALMAGLKQLREYKSDQLYHLKKEVRKFNNLILITCHRRENHGKGIISISKAILKLSNIYKTTLFILPVHPNPQIKEPIFKILKGQTNILLTGPLDYPEFIWVMSTAKIIMTDSGGVQEEAPSLGKPILVLREKTERPEILTSDSVTLVGNEEEKIIESTKKLMDNELDDKKRRFVANAYGDGTASEQIFNITKNFSLVNSH